MSPPTVVALYLTAGVLFGLAAVAWQYRETQAAELFVVLQVVSAAWATLTALGLGMNQGTGRVRIWGVTTGLSLVVIVLWLAFILSYTGRDRWLGARRLGVVSLPLLIGASLYFATPAWGPIVGQLTQERIAAGTVVTTSIGPVGGMLGAYVYLVFLVGLGVVVKTVLEGSRLFVGQALAFVAGSLVTILASFLTILGFPVEGYPLTQIALAGQALFWGYAIFGQRFLRLVPAVAEIGEQAVFDGLNDGLLVVDDEGIVVRANPRARANLGASEPTGDPVAPILASVGVAGIDDLPTRFERNGRTFRTDASRIRNWQGEPVGHTLIVRDVTQLVTREQRLTVLNRILRHNVRNDMNVVMGIGSQLEERSDEDLTEFGETLRRTGRNLSRISDKAIETDQLFAASAADKQVHLPTAIEAVVSPLAADHPDATITTSIDGVSVRTDSRLLARVLEEIVANALEHTGDAPTVRLEVVPVDAGIEITITDDGPGIPDAEVAPITDGEETALNHTSSFGLWFVNWGVHAIGGTVDIETTGTGTRVTLTVPRLDDPGSDLAVTTVESPLLTE